MEGKKTINYNKLGRADLEKELAKKEARLSDLRKKELLGKLDNYYRIVRAKKDIARLKTFICLKKG